MVYASPILALKGVNQSATDIAYTIEMTEYNRQIFGVLDRSLSKVSPNYLVLRVASGHKNVAYI